VTRRRGLARRALALVVPSTSAPAAPNFPSTSFGNSCERLYFEAEDMWSAHDGLARRWTALHYVLGLATVSLAAVAGFGGLQDLLGKTTAAYISLGAAVTAAIWTFLRAAEHQKQHNVMAAAWDNLRADVVTSYLTAGGQLRHARDEWWRSSRVRLARDPWVAPRAAPAAESLSDPGDSAHRSTGEAEELMRRSRERREDRIRGIEPDAIPADPTGWEDVVRTLEARAKALRGGLVGQESAG
jgi:hypothetical protein